MTPLRCQQQQQWHRVLALPFHRMLVSLPAVGEEGLEEGTVITTLALTWRKCPHSC